MDNGMKTFLAGEHALAEAFDHDFARIGAKWVGVDKITKTMREIETSYKSPAR